MNIYKRNLGIILSAFLIGIISIATTIFVLFELAKTNKHPSNMGEDEWLEDFDSLYEFIERDYP